MATTGQAEYHVFVTFTGKGAPAPVGTITELRGGIWYDGRLIDAATLGASFGDGGGLQRASDVTLRIAAGPADALRVLVAGESLIGREVDVTAVMRMRALDGTASETSIAQRLTIIAQSLTPTEVRLRLADIEEAKLDAQYPAQLWSATDWPQLSANDAGLPIPYPVGTALKLPCPQIVADDAAKRYTFGVCTGTPVLRAISSINSALRRVTVVGTLGADLIEVGQAVYLTGTSAADGRYTVSAVVSGSTFEVAETLPASTGGSVRLMPHVRTVYRSGRVVDPSEYTVHHLAGRGPLANGDFETGDFTGWTVSTTGTATASASSKRAVFNATSTLTEARIAQPLATSIGLLHAVAMDVDATSTVSARVDGASVSGAIFLPPGGRRAALMRATSSANSVRVGLFLQVGTTIVDNIALFGTDLVLIEFTRPQIDFNGSPNIIEADVRGVASRNAADEVARLLAAAGVAADPASFSAAAAAATTNRMLVDCDYGRSGRRTIRAILQDHLFLLRAALSRNAAGEYAIARDDIGSVSTTLDDSLGDSVDVSGLDRDSAPKSVSVRYRPGAKDPSVLQHEIKRDVSGGLLGDASPRDLPYVRDHETADRLLCYLALRAQYNARCSATVYRQQFQLSDVLALSSPLNWGAGSRMFSVRAISRTPNANKLDLLEYNAAVYGYVPSPTLPTSAAGQDYVPDYSQTPPAAPTALTITGAQTALAPDGSASAWAAVRCAPPAANWTQIWFSAVHNVTGEIVLAQGSDNGVGAYTATLAGLRPGNVYQLKAWGVNAFNLQGVLQATFNATAIGGGATATTFTAPGYATLPPNVASCTAAQGTGLLVQVSWPRVTLAQDVLGDYVLERNLSGGGWAEVWRGRANSYTDRNFSQYGLTVQYRVRASDRWGNLSASYATSATITINRTIYGGTGTGADINDGTVGTVNRTGVSTIGVGFSNPSPQTTFTISHALGKIPLINYDISPVRNDVWAGINNVTSSSCSGNVNRHYPMPTYTENNDVGAFPHKHEIRQVWSPVTATLNLYLW